MSGNFYYSDSFHIPLPDDDLYDPDQPIPVFHWRARCPYGAIAASGLTKVAVVCTPGVLDFLQRIQIKGLLGLSGHVLSGMLLEPSRPLQFLPSFSLSFTAEPSSVPETEEKAPHLAIPIVPQNEDTFTTVEAALARGDKKMKRKRKSVAVKPAAPPVPSSSPIQE